jgi:hypothetical protein
VTTKSQPGIMIKSAAQSKARGVRFY